MKNLYEQLLNRETKLSLVGLGYVGMPIAVAFARKIDVVGFDLNAAKIALYRSGVDPTHEVGDEAIQATAVEFTADEARLREARFHIVAVPTPVNDDHTPDLSPVEGASRILGRNLQPGSVVVFESTVYPGVTEEVCVPILEQESGLKCGVDFKVGYSPERINPGDKQHRLENIRKIVSGMDAETLECVAKVYELVVDAGNQVFFGCIGEDVQVFIAQGERKNLGDIAQADIPQRAHNAERHGDSVVAKAVLAIQTALLDIKKHRVALVGAAAVTREQIRHIAAEGEHTHLDRGFDNPHILLTLAKQMQGVEHKAQGLGCRLFLRPEKICKLREVLRERQPFNIRAQIKKHLNRLRRIDHIGVTTPIQRKFAVNKQRGRG